MSSSNEPRHNVFRYRQEEPRSGGPPVERPTVDLEITGDAGVTRTFRALVDTGAPKCLFDRGVAELLEIDMREGHGRDAEAHILGGRHDVRLAVVQLNLPPFQGLSWEAEVGFLHDELGLSFTGVLGQEGFLNKWAVSFNYYNGYFVVEEVEAFHERLNVAQDPWDVLNDPLLDSEWDRPTPN